MYLGLSNLGLNSLQQSSFSPLSLFSGGAAGLFIDESDITTLFQDSAGTTPVTAVTQPVGLLLDKRLGARPGPERNPDPAFGTPGLWSTSSGVVVAGGVCTFTAAPDSSVATINLPAPTVGVTYLITFVVPSITSGSIRLLHGGGGGIVASAPGTYTYRAAAAGASTTLTIQCLGVTTGTVSNVSVKELAGNHLLQATTTQRPIVSALYNRLTKTESLSNAVWSATSVTAVDGVTDPLGGSRASTLTATASFGNFWQPATSASVSTSYKIWVRRRSGTGAIRLWNTDNSTFVDIGPSLTSAWQMFTTASTTQAATSVQFVIATSGDQIDVAFPDCRTAADWSLLSIPPYQRVNTTTDYDTVGFPQYLNFDGVDDTIGAGFSAGTLTSNMDGFLLMRRSSAGGVPVHGEVNGKYFLSWTSGGVGAAAGQVGTAVTMWVNGVQVTGGTAVTEGSMFTAFPAGAWAVLEAQNLDLSTWAGFNAGYFNGTYQTAGGLAAMIVCPAQNNLVRTQIRKWLGAKVGLSL